MEMIFPDGVEMCWIAYGSVVVSEGNFHPKTHETLNHVILGIPHIISMENNGSLEIVDFVILIMPMRKLSQRLLEFYGNSTFNVSVLGLSVCFLFVFFLVAVVRCP